MTPHAATRLAKAESFIQQMSSISADAAPAASVHLAYYAMLHAAAAVLLDRARGVPKTHAGTINLFSQMVRGTQEGRTFGRALANAEKLRLTSDYDDQAVPTAEDAVGIAATARDFVAYCRSLL